MTLFGLGRDRYSTDGARPEYLVATIGSFQFWRAGHFSWKLFWPFALPLNSRRVFRRVISSLPQAFYES